MVVKYYGLIESIVSDRDSPFTSKFRSLLCYLLNIQQKLSIVVYSQTEDQIERQNSTIEAYLHIFVNWEQNNWVKLLPRPKFANINIKNANTSHMLFKLNYGYHRYVFVEDTVKLSSKSGSANDLAQELRQWLSIC